ncbi:uncharacterized protein F5147DRAFT_657205 [Suillus discolor]|uniref:DUF6533 domain-containing protein n=1 Tax=Suillus discolor TaxID=1912936 RepID=A0A9P7EXR4_9AGAM|nr:uncharacterized protein F5147DRAFT_657205 [Suillus discolor]KAG2094202.1 hypothetical protein F5147DRAFT_657205 [Suillus discolor]
MTVVSNDPSWWPVINSNIISSYWIVAAGTVVVYDWALTLGQEIELIWGGWKIVLTPRCSRYAILEYHILLPIFWSYYPMNTLISRGNITYYAQNGTDVVIYAMLGIIGAIILEHIVGGIFYGSSDST